MRLKRIYELMPEPKFVIAVGTCACSGAPFNKCYNVLGGVDKVVSVDVYVPGCPPKPEAIIYGISKLLEKIKEAEG
jgi:NADH:ubiquinone oxidoreductase subunit B-like Fe-S oxidoreductase